MAIGQIYIELGYKHQHVVFAVMLFLFLTGPYLGWWSLLGNAMLAPFCNITRPWRTVAPLISFGGPLTMMLQGSCRLYVLFSFLFYPCLYLSTFVTSLYCIANKCRGGVYQFLRAYGICAQYIGPRISRFKHTLLIRAYRRTISTAHNACTTSFIIKISIDHYRCWDEH